jgi:hypothetical protein
VACQQILEHLDWLGRVDELTQFAAIHVAPVSPSAGFQSDLPQVASS